VVVLTIVIVLAVLFFGGTYLVQDSLDTARDRASVAAMRADLSTLRIDLEIYYDDNGTYPRNLSELESVSDSGIRSVGSSVEYAPLYAYSTDGLQYHLGVDLGSNDASPAKEDDFNSIQAGYVGGFDGTSPYIYDLKSFDL